MKEENEHTIQYTDTPYSTYMYTFDIHTHEIGEVCLQMSEI